ncbi:MAG: phenol hydroxylase subunit [Rhodospirillum sp.]|nr:phenol hydroxylase subunit [Rhodospirillum sp.]MCF8488751.1 phenol hydroxylase subunit [Rhodospirillum sp.]MCF8501871.1 phenol hydroxylase subunit [Rhodospirillum sp.]
MVAPSNSPNSAANGVASGFVPGAHPPLVRILGTRLGRFIEFEFSVDRDLSVELVLPVAAFEEFRAAQGAELIIEDGEAARLLGRPGLYKSPKEWEAGSRS